MSENQNPFVCASAQSKFFFFLFTVFPVPCLPPPPLPCSSLNKKFTLKKNAGDNTLDAIFRVFAWSFRCLAAGRFPNQDHESNPFNNAWRNKRLGDPWGPLACSVRSEVIGRCIRMFSTWLAGMMVTTAASGALPPRQP